MLERGELTSGSTFHSAGLVGQLRADPTLTRMNMYSVELYRKLRESEFALGWTESGGIKLASSPERLAEIRRQISWAKIYGLPLDEISPAEAAELFPLMSTEGVVGAAYLPSDGYLDPSQLCHALANIARAGGAQIFGHTRVIGIDVDGRPGAPGPDRPGRHRLRGGGQLRRHVRRRDRPAGRRADPDRADVAPVPDHRGVPAARATSRCRRCATPTCWSITARRSTAC